MYKVAVLMCTFNGDKYVYKQILSIINQKKVNVDIFVIDDGSTDNTIKILKKFKSKIKIFKTQNFKNPTLNFLYLIKKVPQNYDFYSFSDQDDIWLKNKLNYSINTLIKYKGHVLGSRTLYTDKNLKIFGRSPLFKKKVCFENALVQSIAGGNTNVWTKKFNKILANLNYKLPVSHDWFLYQISTFLGYKFIYCKRPLILYRQHEDNLVGSNTGFLNMCKRITMGLKGRFKLWNDMNFFHLMELKKKHKTNDRLIKTLMDFYQARKIKNPLKKIYIIFFKLKIFRQTFMGNVLLIFAILINKI